MSGLQAGGTQAEPDCLLELRRGRGESWEAEVASLQERAQLWNLQSISRESQLRPDQHTGVRKLSKVGKEPSEQTASELTQHGNSDRSLQLTWEPSPSKGLWVNYTRGFASGVRN